MKPRCAKLFGQKHGDKSRTTSSKPGPAVSLSAWVPDRPRWYANSVCISPVCRAAKSSNSTLTCMGECSRSVGKQLESANNRKYFKGKIWQTSFCPFKACLDRTTLPQVVASFMNMPRCKTLPCFPSLSLLQPHSATSACSAAAKAPIDCEAESGPYSVPQRHSLNLFGTSVIFLGWYRTLCAAVRLGKVQPSDLVNSVRPTH